MRVEVEHVHLVYISTHLVKKQLVMLTGLPCLLPQFRSPQQTSPCETASWQTYLLLSLERLASQKLNLGMMGLKQWPLG